MVWQAPWLEHPEEMVELIAHLWLNQLPETFAQLTNRLAPEKLEALLLGVQAGSTHAVSQFEGAYALAAAEFLHMLGAAVWIGGIAFVAVMFALYRWIDRLGRAALGQSQRGETHR